ncbi:hypothetical protein VPH159E362A_0059 [Vibrio phage 159E36-2a]
MNYEAFISLILTYRELRIKSSLSLTINSERTTQ